MKICMILARLLSVTSATLSITLLHLLGFIRLASIVRVTVVHIVDFILTL